jgi:hypothetical protein
MAMLAGWSGWPGSVAAEAETVNLPPSAAFGFGLVIVTVGAAVPIVTLTRPLTAQRPRLVVTSAARSCAPVNPVVTQATDPAQVRWGGQSKAPMRLRPS